MLKQLVAHVGREPFRDGLRAYFAKHAWGNTTLDDLLSELEATSGRDLRTWSRQWLETAGVSTLRPVARGRRPRPHRLGGHRADLCPGPRDAAPAHPARSGCTPCATGALHRTDRLELDVDGERTAVPELVGREQPDLLLVNDDDLAYAKIRLDERSLATALAHPRGFTSLAAARARAGLAVGHDPRRRDGRPALRRRRARDPAGRDRLHAAAHPDHPAADRGALLHARPSTAPRSASADPRPALGARPWPPSPAATPSCSSSAPPRP